MHRERAFRACRPGNIRAGFWVMIVVGCGSSGGSEVLRFRSSGAAGVLVNDGAGVTPHRWLKVAFIPSHLVKATFSHDRTASEATTVTPTTSGPPRTPLSHQKRHTHWRSWFLVIELAGLGRRHEGGEVCRQGRAGGGLAVANPVEGVRQFDALPI